MVSLFGTTSETIWRCRLRAIRVLRSLSLCMGLPHLRGAGPQHARAVSWARDRIRDTRGRRANTQKSGKRRMTPSRVCTTAACCAPPSSRRRPARTCRPRALGGFELARPHSPRALVSKGLARDASDASAFSSYPSGRRPEEGWGRLSQPFAPSLLVRRSFAGKAATPSPIAGDREVRRVRRLTPAAVHCIHLCRCHKSTSRLT